MEKPLVDKSMTEGDVIKHIESSFNKEGAINLLKWLFKDYLNKRNSPYEAYKATMSFVKHPLEENMGNSDSIDEGIK